MSEAERGPSAPAKREDDDAPHDAARRRAILKALAAAGPLIITVTPFYARAEYNGTVYEPYIDCNLQNNKDKDKCKFPTFPPRT
jgi:hypothetical protein